MSDKRSVTTDALDTLGTIIGDAEKRDAIHLAVEPATAGTILLPSQHVSFSGGVARPDGKLVGIVDPFLKQFVEPGQRFWLVVYPRQIRSLRHVWEHPDFPASGETVIAQQDKAASEKWPRDFIKSANCPDYDTVIHKAIRNDSWSREYLHFDDMDAHGDIPPEFWDHIEVVTGHKIEAEDRATHFSCSC